MMKNIIIGFILFIMGIVAIFLISFKEELSPIMIMPWEITIMKDGNTQIFGIHLGKTTLKQAQHIFNIHGKTAIFSQLDHKPTVESYFESVNLGGLSAKVVLNLMVTDQQIKDMLVHSTNNDLQPSGARRYELQDNYTSMPLNLPIISITYIPSVVLDKIMVLNRFGEAKNVKLISTNQPDNITWNYPKIGLSITFNDEEKAVLQYSIPD